MKPCERCGHVVPGRRRTCLTCGRKVCRYCSYVWTESGPPAYACDESTVSVFTECRRIGAERSKKAKR